MDTSSKFLESLTPRFRSHQGLSEKAMDQLDDEQLLVHPGEESNSIAIIAHHMSGNLLSRFTDFLESDGEKPWRQRDSEFEETGWDRKTMMQAWKKGWDCLYQALEQLTEKDLVRSVSIRGEPLTVIDALIRALAHQAYHAGQIVYIAKWLSGPQWKTLTIPKAPARQHPPEPKP